MHVRQEGAEDEAHKDVVVTGGGVAACVEVLRVSRCCKTAQRVQINE